MRLKSLGGLSLEPGEFSRPKPLLLLAYLTVEGAKEKRHLYELFWPDATNPANSLRVVSKLLKDLNSDLLSGDERTVGTQIESDIASLQTALANQDTERVAELHQGGFLAEFSLPDWGVELEEWVGSTRAFLSARVRGAFIRAAEIEAARGAFDLALGWAERAYELERHDQSPEDLERLYPLLIATHSSFSTEVKRQAADYGIVLSLSPDEARRRYFTPSLEGSTAGSTEARVVSNNLPRAKTSFVGRDPELIKLGQMMGQNEVRLITLLGPGGIGKTRLALQLAGGQLRENNFTDGVYFVALEALSGPEQIPQTLAQTLGIKVKDEPLMVIKAEIGNKRLLLVLDNFEHLVDGALLVSELLEACPHLSIIVTSRERLNLEEEFVLGLEGLTLPKDGKLEQVSAEYNDAIRLFVQRARRARLEFQPTAETLPHVLSICKFVGGSPLGIELAAVWLRSLTISELAHEISQVMDELETPSRNIAERHQSLRAVFEHSWKLLKPKEQTTLARLTVFLDGFTREAAGQVTDATIPLLTSLVDKSLLRQSTEGRYDFHPLLYQFASQKLSELPEKEYIRTKHGHYFLNLLETNQKVGNQAQLRCCQEEHDNLLTALTWSQEADHALIGLRLGVALQYFWETQGYIAEGRHWITTVLTHPSAAAFTEERARALLTAGMIVSRQSERALAVRYGQEALEISKSLGLDEVSIRVYILLANEANSQSDIANGKKYAEAGLDLARKLGYDELIAATLTTLASLAEGLGDVDEAWTLSQESLSLLRKLGRQKTPQFSLNLSNLGYMAWLRGDLETAKALLEEAIAVAEDLQHRMLLCGAQDNLSVVMLDLGDLPETQRLSRLALEYRWSQIDRWGMTFSFENFACLAVKQHDARRAALLWGVAERLREEINAPRIDSWQDRQERFVALAQSQLDEVGFSAAWQVGRLMTLEEMVKVGLEMATLIATS